MDIAPKPDSLMSFTPETANRRIQDCSSGLSNHSLIWRMLLDVSTSPSGVNPASTILGKNSTCLVMTPGSALNSAGLNIRSAWTLQYSLDRSSADSLSHVLASFLEKRAICWAERSCVGSYFWL